MIKERKIDILQRRIDFSYITPDLMEVISEVAKKNNILLIYGVEDTVYFRGFFDFDLPTTQGIDFLDKNFPIKIEQSIFNILHNEIQLKIFKNGCIEFTGEKNSWREIDFTFDILNKELEFERVSFCDEYKFIISVGVLIQLKR